MFVKSKGLRELKMFEYEESGRLYRRPRCKFATLVLVQRPQQISLNACG